MIGPSVWLLACGGGEPGTTAAGLVAQDFAGPEAFRMEFVQPGDDSGDELDDTQVLHLHAEDGVWTFRQGPRWSEATPLGDIDVDVEDGLWLDGTQVLPARIEAGATADGVQVTALGELQVWYGAFPMAATVSVDAGLPGEHSFAQGIGPIRLELFDGVWELAFYE